MVVSPGWLEDVRGLAQVHTHISPFMVHRRLRINRKAAESLLCQLETEGVVGPAGPGHSREVLRHG